MTLLLSNRTSWEGLVSCEMLFCVVYFFQDYSSKHLVRWLKNLVPFFLQHLKCSSFLLVPCSLWFISIKPRNPGHWASSTWLFLLSEIFESKIFLSTRSRLVLWGSGFSGDVICLSRSPSALLSGMALLMGLSVPCLWERRSEKSTEIDLKDPQLWKTQHQTLFCQLPLIL